MTSGKGAGGSDDGERPDAYAGEHAEPDWLRRQFAALDLCVRDFVCAHARGATEPTTFNTKEDIVVPSRWLGGMTPEICEGDFIHFP